MKRALVLAIISLALLAGCNGGSDFFGAPAEGQLSITGLQDISPQAAYEGWLIVDGAPVSTGVFSVDAAGNLSDTLLHVSTEDLLAATTFVLTVEPVPDPDPAPNVTHLLAGDFDGNMATISVSHPAAMGDDFTSAQGIYILATPTNGVGSNENSGIWFFDGVDQGMDLPVLPAGWIYEGWVLMNSFPLSTGTFLDPNGPDNAASFSGPQPSPPFPGEDFLTNAPPGHTFPTDLAGMTTFISIEPYPDLCAAPCFLRLLTSHIPDDAVDATPYPMINLSTGFPRGTVVR